MHVLFDTDVVLDVLLSREPFLAEAEPLWRLLGGNELTGYLAAITVTNAHYLLRKYAGLEIARNSVQECLDIFFICPVSTEVLSEALSMVGNDYEDNVQITCALKFGLDAIITRDKRGFKHSPILVLTPSEAIAQIEAAAQEAGTQE
jgi:predicted nucleic acid-binding protein